MIVKIAFSADDNYAQHLCVALFSLLKATSKNNFYNIHILDGGISQENFEKIHKSLGQFLNKKIFIHKISKELFKDKQKILHLNEASYFRILLPDLLKEVNKILYLDCDLLIFEDVAKLYQEKLSNQEYLGCAKIFHPNYQSVLFKQFPIKLDFCFNSGVMLMDLKKMRASEVTTQLLDFTQKNNNKLLTADQDVFNLVMRNKVKEIDPKWNLGSYIFYAKNHRYCQLSKQEFIELKNQPGIIHFDGAKPWSFGNFHPYKKLYFAILDQTEFKFWRPRFKLTSLLANTFFYLATKIMNLLPDHAYKLIETYYLKNNFLEKRYRETLG